MQMHRAIFAAFAWGCAAGPASEHCSSEHCPRSSTHSLLQNGIKKIQDYVEIKDEKPTITVACTFGSVSEDSFPDDDSLSWKGYDYNVCTDVDGVTYYLVEDNTTKHFADGEALHLTLSVVTPSPNVRDSPHSDTTNDSLYRVANVVSLLSEGGEVRASSLDEPAFLSGSKPKIMDVLVILTDYNDNKPSYTNEKKVMDDLYGTMSDMVTKSTYGRVLLPRERGRVVTVKMGENWNGRKKCDAGQIMRVAKEKVRQQHPSVDPDSFTFREFHIPDKPNGGCTWGGVADAGCGHPSLLPRPGGCWTVIRVPAIHARMHELGHNLGLLHADGFDPKIGKFREYGDPAAALSASYVFTGFVAPAKGALGVLRTTPGEVINWSGPSNEGFMALGSLSLPLNQPGAMAVAIKFTCPKCRTKINVDGWRKVSDFQKISGGYVWVSFRGDEGYSSYKLGKELQNKVYVHWARPYRSPTLNDGTELWAVLASGENFSPPSTGYTVHVCSILGDIAKVTVGESLNHAMAQCKKGPRRVVDSFSDQDAPTFTASSFKSAKGKSNNDDMCEPEWASTTRKCVMDRDWPAWCPKTASPREWLQADVGKDLSFVKKIRVQGRPSGSNWGKVTKLRVMCSQTRFATDQNEWTSLGSDLTFGRSQDCNGDETRYLSAPGECRSLRFYPLSWRNYPSLRVEAYGCETTIQPWQVSFSASSHDKSGRCEPKSALLASGATCVKNRDWPAWCPASADSNQWLQLTMDTPTLITKLSVWGRYGGPRWGFVRTLEVKCLMTDGTWKILWERFPGPAHQNCAEAIQPLPRPMTCRALRFRPLQWGHWPSIAVKVYQGMSQSCSKPLLHGQGQLLFPGQAVALYNPQHKRFITMKAPGSFTTATVIKGWETFIVEDTGDNLIALYNPKHKQYIRMLDNKVDTFGDRGPLTRFSVENVGSGLIALKSNMLNCYLRTDGRTVLKTRKVEGVLPAKWTWERFEVVAV